MLLDQGNLLCFTTTRRNCSRIYEMAAFAMLPSFPSSAIPESSCGYLLQELKLIWDEVGQDQLERERILLELEQECIDMYRRKVDSANISRVRLHQALADSEAEFTNLLLSLGERSFPGRPEKLTGTLKQQLDAITPALHEMQLRKEERMNQFREVQTQIQRIASEIAGHQPDCNVLVNEGDLSLKKLDEHQNELQRLHKEKNARLRKVEDHIKVVQNLAETMAMDASTIIGDIHPSLLGGSTAQQSRNISDTILEGLKSKVEQLKDEKRKRTEKLYKLGKALTNLWNLMDTSIKDQQKFYYMNIYTSSAPTDHTLRPGSLSIDIIHQVESEVERLDQLKASKMKELFLKKLSELREICQKSHLEVPSGSEMDKIMNLIMSGEMDHADLLVIMEEHISQAKEEACSRKDIMEKVEKWMASCEEEQWLEEYSKDENRYSVSRGAHKNLKRAERARIIVNKIPAYTSMQDQDIAQVPLMAMLKEYTLLKQEKEEEKQRQRERKKVQTQITAEHENSFGSRPNTSTTRRSNNILNSSFVSAPSSRRLSIISQHQRSKDNYANKGSIKLQTRQMLSNCSHAPNSKEDAASEISITFSG
ncbi:Microtubule associated protein (MAP65/ASE1 family) [Musa troglodytarum]|uniref:Microtubule associated protein (MAP65/ASE1 family) n=2 Tax=Musa troglodytarum TaxID=320322 RepID=A0A9E7ES19_9LILI|nr:Microtubule associated protein (MAP65/ASE1 family) [Musa troglodytarum]